MKAFVRHSFLIFGLMCMAYLVFSIREDKEASSTQMIAWILGFACMGIYVTQRIRATIARLGIKKPHDG